MDWSLRGCSRQGHVTYRPDEPDLAERLHATTALGDAWRCLRCGTFAVGEPTGSGPAEDAPIVLRGKALREAFILRLLAAERGIRAVVIGLLAWAVVKFSSSQTSLQQLFEKELPRLKPLASSFNYDLDKSPTVDHIRSLLHSRQSTLHLVTAFLVVYTVIELVEAIGLWSLQRWGEYVAVVGTSLFLPLEIYELTKHVTYVKIAAFVINVLLVVYLVLSKRLFGLRGGRAAFEAKRHGQSLLEVEAAALRIDLRQRREGRETPRAADN